MRETHGVSLAEPLIDDEAWPPLLEAIRTARSNVRLTQLLFEPDFRPFHARFADEIERAGMRGARVRVLVNENAAVPDSFDELRERFASTSVEVRALPMTPNVLHAKLLVADDEAYFLDAPFEQKYADSRAHTFRGARRRGEIPFHAVSLRLRGRVVMRLGELFDALWFHEGEGGRAEGGTEGAEAEGDGTLALAQGLPSPPPSLAPSFLRGSLATTSPAGVWEAEPSGAILEAYADALARAEDFVYLETQYFTSPRMVELLAEALAREPRLDIILVVNEHMDVPTYDAWQAERLAALGHPRHPRLGVFSLWSPRRARDDPALRPVYVHSKVAIIDDQWATIGSANLDSISLHDAEEFGFVAPRNVELNASFDDADFAAALRRRLWGEHLGDADVWRATRPPGGWLAHWRRIADANLARVRAGEPYRITGRALPLGALVARGLDRIARPARA